MNDTAFHYDIIADISSYISTVRKQGMNLLESIKTAVAGNPVSFSS